MAHNQEYLQKIDRPIIHYTFKVIPMDKDENELNEITSDVTGGDININLQNGSRRNGSVELVNTNNTYTLDPNNSNKFWFDNKFKIQTGIVDNSTGQEILFDQGVFVMGEPNFTDDFAGNATATYELYDKFAYLDGTLSGEILNDFLIPNGTNIITALRTVFETAFNDGIQIAYNVKPLIAEPNDFDLPYQFDVDRGRTYFDVLNQLAEIINYVVYFDAEGYPRAEPRIIPENEAPALTLGEQSDIKVSLNRRYEINNIRNSVRVEGITWNDGVTHDHTSTLTTGATGTSRIGLRAMFLSDDGISTDSLAQQRADYEVQQRSRIVDTVNLSFVPLDNIREGDIIRLTSARADITDIDYQITQFTLPLIKDSEASVDMQRTVDLG